VPRTQMTHNFHAFIDYPADHAPLEPERHRVRPFPGWEPTTPRRARPAIFTHGAWRPGRDGRAYVIEAMDAQDARERVMHVLGPDAEVLAGPVRVG